MRKKVLLF